MTRAPSRLGWITHLGGITQFLSERWRSAASRYVKTLGSGALEQPRERILRRRTTAAVAPGARQCLLNCILGVDRIGKEAARLPLAAGLQPGPVLALSLRHPADRYPPSDLTSSCTMRVSGGLTQMLGRPDEAALTIQGSTLRETLLLRATGQDHRGTP